MSEKPLVGKPLLYWKYPFINDCFDFVLPGFLPFGPRHLLANKRFPGHKAPTWSKRCISDILVINRGRHSGLFTRNVSNPGINHAGPGKSVFHGSGNPDCCRSRFGNDETFRH